MGKPLILVDPLPRALDLICDAPTRARLEPSGELAISQEAPMSGETCATSKGCGPAPIARTAPSVALGWRREDFSTAWR